jgi:hypothetical protein
MKASTNVSRRKILQALPLAAAPLGLQLTAQAPPTQDADLEGARQALRVSAQIVRQVPLPMTVEPATRFIPRS